RRLRRSPRRVSRVPLLRRRQAAADPALRADPEGRARYHVRRPARRVLYAAAVRVLVSLNVARTGPAAQRRRTWIPRTDTRTPCAAGARWSKPPSRSAVRSRRAAG